VSIGAAIARSALVTASYLILFSAAMVITLATVVLLQF